MEEKGSKERENKEEEPKYVAPKAYMPPLPFPQRFQKVKLDKQFGKFLEVLKSLHVTIPFTDALAQMPSYAKFLKDILSNKKKLKEFETVALTKESSAILQNKLPPKLKDPGSFSIPCHIGDISIDKALCDLGANRSIEFPIGVIENVSLKVEKFFIPVDFLVLEMEEDVHIPIILDRPFLTTAGAVIDVKNGRLTLEVGKEKVEFNLFQAMKKKDDSNSCLRIDVIDEVVREVLKK
ncbi:hypothetical protein P3X46_034241 [Hevea brasiliensis]|uniref:Aspartic peptidase DDI1-type domain-containing protein n=1 Tax=Hevea brasiliensis TaxID=3981 RepID=A0ABQ9K8L2_HEVBR|nr:hypothetical protein P3X46_034241 [Hevea brasiliensis]